MRVLLDECLPRRLKRELAGHDARTGPEMGWARKRNGELLRLAVAAEFDVFLTVDRKLPHQQNLSAFNIAVVVLEAKTNTLADLTPLMPQVLEEFASFDRQEICRRTQIEQRDQSDEFAPETRYVAIERFPQSALIAFHRCAGMTETMS